MLRRFLSPTHVLFIPLMTVAPLFADTGYQLPPKEIIDIIDVKPEPSISMSPEASCMLFADRDSMPDIADFARRIVPLAGMRIDPVTNSDFQTDFYRGLSFRFRSADSPLVPIPIPAPVKLSGISWSHDSKSFAYTFETTKGTELWWASIDAPDKPIKLTDQLSGVLFGFDWMPDGKRILCALVPENRGPEPTAPAAPLGPNIQESYGNKSPTRTFQDLLTNPHDEALFDYFGTTQLAILEPKQQPRLLGEPALWASSMPAPDGKHLLVTKIKRPFSYLQPVGSFPKSIEVIDSTGALVYLAADVPPEENIPIEGVRLGRRSLQWHAGRPATLVWVEALDGGDPKNKVPYRDQIKTLDAPFRDIPRDLIKV